MLSAVTVSSAKADLQRYLQSSREAMVWKLDGATEYDVRRPMTPTGTNLLGLVKHLAGGEIGYFGDTFMRPFPERLTWFEGDDREANLWATAEESREEVIGLYHRAWRHADQTIAALVLESPGRVPWWPPERADVTLHRILVHVIAETARHAGHADIVRELIDGGVGLRRDNDNMAAGDPQRWQDYRDRLEGIAQQAGHGTT